LIFDVFRVLKSDAREYLEEKKLRKLISTHSEFTTSAPIYLWSETAIVEKVQPPEKKVADDDEVVTTEEDESEVEEVTKPGWVRINDQPPLWMRLVSIETSPFFEQTYLMSFL
jgi:HSP90 family molecular chaperone